MGLVETGVGLVPAGWGCKEVLWRWSQTKEAKEDPDYAPLQVFNIIGYAKTATSTVEAEPLKFIKPEDKKVMNRNSLFEVSRKLIEENKEFTPPKESTFNLSGKPLKEKMIKVLEKLYNEKIILDHGMTVGKELANVLSGGDTTINKTLIIFSLRDFPDKLNVHSLGALKLLLSSNIFFWNRKQTISIHYFFILWS